MQQSPLKHFHIDRRPHIRGTLDPRLTDRHQQTQPTIPQVLFGRYQPFILSLYHFFM
jgi:hypothetical protein